MKIASVADVKAKVSGYIRASEAGQGISHEAFWKDFEGETEISEEDEQT